jgi:hypothetical protein
LALANSPYLKEHGDNPVDWFEWGPVALEKAKSENKPLIVSIGYAACHWCHVMEEESFMDTAVARIMNENFISIKIDREERPDIDQIYITAAQLISGNAGWPLNAFTLPDGKPFYVATYFPKQQWKKLLLQITDAYKNEHDNVARQAEALTKGIQSNDLIPTAEVNPVAFDIKTYQSIFERWQDSFDFKLGGLKGTPKFPLPVLLEYALQHHYLTGNKKSLEFAYTSLDAMARGGINDQLGGGFARYATDSIWKVPHFEKMLYDNAQLISLYSHAYQQSRNPLYERVIHETLRFIKDELTSAEGGFYSSINADSEGEEGTFYVWKKSEIENILMKDQAALVSAYYTVSDSGNWEDNKNVLCNKMSSGEFAAKHSLSIEQWENLLAIAQKKLLAKRDERIHPSLDNKILTSWNAMMLTAYVDAYFATGSKEYLETALKSGRFLKSKMSKENGELMRCYQGNKSSIDAFLDDYAFLSKAYIHLYEATLDIQWLKQAKSIAGYALNHFQDQQTGFFYFTSDLSERLIARKAELVDHVMPSSNAVLAEVLYKLGAYFDNTSYQEMANVMVGKITADISKNGPHYAQWVSVMGMIAYQPYEVAVMGEEASNEIMALQQHYLPITIFMGGSEENLPLLENKYVKGETIIYVCQNKICKLPVKEVTKALEQMNSK